jgi:hypothetical protein
MFELFVDNMSEDNRRIIIQEVERTSASYNTMLSNVSQGTGTKDLNMLINSVTYEVISRSSAISKQDMAELYIYNSAVHNTGSNLKTNSFLDNIDIVRLLSEQNMIWNFTGKTKVWKSVKETLDNKGFVGVKTPNTKEQLDDLYEIMRSAEKKIILENTNKTYDYITISYVQTKSKDDFRSNHAPSFWSETVIDAVTKIKNMGIYEKDVGIWWDKLAAIQYNNAQDTWPATANLQFPTHMTLVCLPLANNKDYDVPLWSNISKIDKLIGDSISCILSCDSIPLMSKRKTLVSPTMARRCWPFMEICLANINIGAFTTAEQIGFLIDTVQILMFIWYICNKIFHGFGRNFKAYNEYCYDCSQYYDENICSNVRSIMHSTLNDMSIDQDYINTVQQEFISIIGFLDGLTAQVNILELYDDEEKGNLHPKIKAAYNQRTEFNHNEEHNIDLLKHKLNLVRWKPELVADAVNELLNGFSHDSDCYKNADKIMAAIVLMDIELTQEVLHAWNPESDLHPFTGLFTEENWRKICTSDCMNCIMTNSGSVSMQDVRVFWMGCMQSRLKGDVFMEITTDIPRLHLNEDTIHMMQRTLQMVFREKVNVKGHYYEGGDACIHQFKLTRNMVDCCIECSDTNIQKSGYVIGRYKLFGTKQMKGFIQGIVNGDTQIVILDINHRHPQKVGNVTITLNNPFTVICPNCHKINILVNNLENSKPLGVVEIYYCNDTV